MAIILVERPRKASLPLLLLFTGLLLEQLVALSHRSSKFLAKDVPWVVAPAAAILGIITILNMPLRDPALPREDICPAFDTPTVQLRTPEDNLTPWQYMTVSWMDTPNGRRGHLGLGLGVQACSAPRGIPKAPRFGDEKNLCREWYGLSTHHCLERDTIVCE